MSRGRQRLRWEDSVKRDLAGVGGEWRTRGRNEGVKTGISGDGSYLGTVTEGEEKHKSPISIDAA